MTSKGILRLSHAEVRVPDLQLATAYYAEVVGLVVTRTETNRTFLKGWDEHQHHSLILSEEATYGLNSLAFKVIERAELDRLAKRVEDAEISVEWFEPEALNPASGTVVRFTAPSGHVVDLDHGQAQVANGL